ncbi:MAG: hypothetical protein QXY50_00910 [Candidatus Caldarchaeum sp.]
MKPAYIHGRWLKVEKTPQVSSSRTQEASHGCRGRRLHRLQVRVTDEMREWLEAKAGESRASMAFVVRRLVREAMRREHADA